jgi:hypothetical protein
MTKMSQNDFYVAIQGILMAAKDAGWKDDQIESYALDAVYEWADEVNPPEEDLDD